MQKKWDDNRLMTYAQVNLEQFEDRVLARGRRSTPATGTTTTTCSGIAAGAFLENVAENGESIRQDIYRYGFYCGADVRPTRVWAFGGTYTYAHYSDDNDAHQAFLYNEVSLSLPPKQLKLVQRVERLGFRDQTDVPDRPAGPVQPARHRSTRTSRRTVSRRASAGSSGGTG